MCVRACVCVCVRVCVCMCCVVCVPFACCFFVLLLFDCFVVVAAFCIVCFCVFRSVLWFVRLLRSLVFSFCLCLSVLTLLTRCTDGQHEVPTTVYHSAFGDDFVQR